MNDTATQLLRVATMEPPEIHRLVDTLISPEVAERAMRVYDRYLPGEGHIFAFQRAFLLAAEEAGYHRHLRANAPARRGAVCGHNGCQLTPGHIPGHTDR